MFVNIAIGIDVNINIVTGNLITRHTFAICTREKSDIFVDIHNFKYAVVISDYPTHVRYFHS